MHMIVSRPRCGIAQRVQLATIRLLDGIEERAGPVCH